MKISYRYTYQEYDALLKARSRRASRFPRAREAFFWVIIVANLALGLWGIWTAFQNGQSLDWFHFLNIGLAVLLLILRYGFGPWARKRYFRNQMLEDKQIEAEFTDEGLATFSDDSEGKYKWSAVVRVDDEPEHIIFWTSKVMGISVPKSAMSDHQLSDLKVLVGTNVRDQELVK